MVKWCVLAVCLALSGLGQGAVQAAEITVVGGMGVISGIRDLAAGFEKATGNKVNAVFAPNVMGYVNAGMPADIVALNPPIIDDMIKSGKIVGPRVDFARAGIGVAVKAGAPKLDLGSVDAFKRAMLNAKSIGYSTAGSGLMVAKIMQELGLTEALKARTRFLDGFPAAEAVARGQVEIALQQINVILPVAGAELGGVLPPELQRYNEFAAGVLATSKEKGVAADMVKFMGAPENAALVRKSGMEPPAR